MSIKGQCHNAEKAAWSLLELLRNGSVKWTIKIMQKYRQIEWFSYGEDDS